MFNEFYRHVSSYLTLFCRGFNIFIDPSILPPLFQFVTLVSRPTKLLYSVLRTGFMGSIPYSLSEEESINVFSQASLNTDKWVCRAI